MMTKTLLVVCLMLSAIAVGRSQSTGGESKSAAQIISAESVKWATIRSGQEASVLWGDPRSGAYGRFNRFAAGFEDRPHYHSRDLRVVIVSGTMIVRIAAAASQEVGVGSYVMIPGGTPHTHSCKSGSPCVLFVQQEGPNDNVAVSEVLQQ
jgi:mannose-6-phosphate isomerase-like protein (cupin superfamily)